MSPVLLGQGFLTSAILISGARSLFVTGGCPLHWRLFGKITSPSTRCREHRFSGPATENASRYCKMSPGGRTDLPLMENCCAREEAQPLVAQCPGFTQGVGLGRDWRLISPRAREEVQRGKAACPRPHSSVSLDPWPSAL